MMRVFATLLLALVLTLMPLGMPGGSALGASPETAESACLEHDRPQHQPDAPAAPEPKGALHCQMCVALAQPDQADMPGQQQASAGHATVNLPQLAGIGDDVSVPPPRNG